MFPISLIRRIVAFMLMAWPMAINAAIVLDYNWNVNTTIPDDSAVGITSSKLISGTGILAISDIEVSLNLAPGTGWNGDLYAYLRHDEGGFSVLLNRIGATSSNPIGSGTAGMDIRFTATATQDVHTVTTNSGMLTGTYQADGRTADPLVVLDTSPRTAPLSSFLGAPADGTWTLFIADMSGGDTSTINSWGLRLTGEDLAAIPEPSGALLLACCGVFHWTRRRRTPTT